MALDLTSSVCSTVNTTRHEKWTGRSRTFNLGNSASKDVLLNLSVLEASHDFVNDSLGELGLLALLGLLFKSDPAVQHRLKLGGDSDLLLLNEGLGLELGGFLDYL
jgi:hypothetical protein